jgi:hypothetical protein
MKTLTDDRPDGPEIHDLIQTCDLLPSEDTTRRLLDICMALNKRIDDIEADITRERLRNQRTTNTS